jgi:hypothetical protein
MESSIFIKGDTWEVRIRPKMTEGYVLSYKKNRTWITEQNYSQVHLYVTDLFAMLHYTDQYLTIEIPGFPMVTIPAEKLPELGHHILCRMADYLVNRWSPF